MKNTYMELYKATAAFSDEINPDSFPPNAWNMLTEIWGKTLEGEWNPFYVVLHKLLWGVYPHKRIPPVLQPLMELVEQILLSGNAIAQAWHHTKLFKLSLFNVERGRYDREPDTANSFQHTDYLLDHLIYEVLRIQNMNCTPERLSDLEAYRATVNKLIPQSSSWNAAEWGDDMNVLRELDSLYGTNFTEYTPAYDELIYMLSHYSEETTIWSMANIRVFSEKLAEAIWGEDIESILDWAFVCAAAETRKYIEDGRPLDEDKELYRYPEGVFEYDALRNSWLFSYIKDRIGKGIYENDSLVKKAYFNVVVG